MRLRQLSYLVLITDADDFDSGLAAIALCPIARHLDQLLVPHPRRPLSALQLELRGVAVINSNSFGHPSYQVRIRATLAALGGMLSKVRRGPGPVRRPPDRRSSIGPRPVTARAGP